MLVIVVIVNDIIQLFSLGIFSLFFSQYDMRSIALLSCYFPASISTTTPKHHFLYFVLSKPIQSLAKTMIFQCLCSPQKSWTEPTILHITSLFAHILLYLHSLWPTLLDPHIWYLHPFYWLCLYWTPYFSIYFRAFLSHVVLFLSKDLEPYGSAFINKEKRIDPVYR